MSRYRSIGALGTAAVLVGSLLLVAAPASAARDRTPPTTPSNLRITASTGPASRWRGTGRRTWNASTDDSDPQSDIRYDVYVDGALAAVGLGTRTILSCATADPVEIVVKAVDTSGNESGPSNTVLFTGCDP